MSTDKKHDQTKTLDLRGLMCPEPVLRTKKILDQKPEGAVEVLVQRHQCNELDSPCQFTRLVSSIETKR